MVGRFLCLCRIASRSKRLAVVGLWAMCLAVATLIIGIGNTHGESRSKRSGQSVIHEVLDLKGFDEIRIDAVAEVEITIGPEFRVELEVDDDLVDFLDVFVKGKSLVIDMEDKRNIDSDRRIHFDITMPELNSVVVKGVARVAAGVLNNERLEVSCPGVGEMEIRGVSRQLSVDLQGVGDLDFTDLVADVVSVNVSGVGDVVVHADNRLDARVDGMGTIRYRGDPRDVKTRVNGLGRIKRLK